jgi:hypothetical protein
MLDNTLYCRTIDGLLLKFLGPDQSRIVSGEVHEGICGTHQPAHKIKWLFHRGGFYWPIMLNDCLGTTKVANHAKSLEMCNWLL